MSEGKRSRWLHALHDALAEWRGKKSAVTITGGLTWRTGERSSKRSYQASLQDPTTRLTVFRASSY